MKTKTIFCANEQKDTEQTLTVDNNGEILAVCDCGRFLKLPAGLTTKQANDLIDQHKKDNKLSEEQLLVEENRAASEEVIDEITEITGKVTIEEPT